MDNSKKAELSTSLNAAGSSTATSKANQELDNLLDSALDDFDKPLSKVIQVQPSGTSSTKKQEQSSCNLPNKEWTGDEFKQVQDAMKSFLQEDPQFKAQFEQLTSDSSSDNLGASLDEAMKLITDSAQNISGTSPEDFQQFVNNFDKLGFGGGDLNGSQVPDFMPFFQSFMENLLSKEILYPALKEIIAKYPEWLSENRQKVSENDYINYTKQYEIMIQICEEFETSYDSSDEGHKKSFDKILALMQKMQEYGSPPKEIMGDFPSSLPFDDLSNFKDGAMPEQCSIM